MLLISSSNIPSSQVHVLFLPCSTGVLPEFFPSHLVLTGVVSNSFLFRSFDSRHIRRFVSYSSVLDFVHPLSFVLVSPHPLLFRLVPKISGRDLLLVEENCNAPNPMC